MKNLSTSEMNELVKDAILGDRHAFSMIYRHTFDAQYFRSLSMLKDSALAEEAVQTAYAKALENLPSLTAPEGFLSWMGSITYHCCVDIIRNNKKLVKQTALDDKLLSLLEVKMKEESPLDSVITKEKKDTLLNIIDSLSDTHKAVIILRYYEDLSLKDIARIMNCSTGTIKSRLHYAQRELRGKLKSRGITGIYTVFGISKVLTRMISCQNQKEDVRTDSTGKRLKAAYYCGMAGCAMMAGLLHMPRPAITDVSVKNPHIYTNIGKEITIHTEGTEPDQVLLLYNDGRKAAFQKAASGVYSVEARENGSLRIRLLKYGLAVDQREVKIDHIDKTPPELVDYDRSRHEIEVTVYDSQSGPDLNHVKAEAAGKDEVPILKVNHEKRTIRLPYSGETMYLTLWDHAGNEIMYCIEADSLNI